MTRRKEDLVFAAEERLLRQVGKKDVCRNEVDPRKLRLQISVNRTKYLNGVDPPLHDPKRTGLAAISPEKAVGAAKLPVKVMCVDEQTSTDLSHALVVLAVDHGDEPLGLEAAVDAVRNDIAKAFVIVKEPT